MQKIFYVPDIEKEIKDVFMYGHQLIENPVGTSMDKTVQEALGEYIINHKFTLSSFNWLVNLGIDKIYSEEFHRGGFTKDTRSWYIGINIIVNYWLERLGCFVISNKQYHTPDSINLLVQYGRNLKQDTSTGKEIEMLISAIKSGHVENFFSKTLSALNKAYQNDIELCRFIEERNQNDIGIKLPVSFVIDPIYLTITFIH